MAVVTAALTPRATPFTFAATSRKSQLAFPLLTTNSEKLLDVALNILRYQIIRRLLNVCSLVRFDL